MLYSITVREYEKCYSVIVHWPHCTLVNEQKDEDANRVRVAGRRVGRWRLEARLALQTQQLLVLAELQALSVEHTGALRSRPVAAYSTYEYI